MNLLELFAPIRTFIFSLDGVLTDGRLLLSPDGQPSRAIDVKDLYAIRRAIAAGYHVSILSGGDYFSAGNIFSNLGLADICFNAVSRKAFVIEKAALSPESSVLYMGCDLPDIEAMLASTLPCCPSDAVPEVKLSAAYFSPRPGGHGCVRDVIEKVLKINGAW